MSTRHSSGTAVQWRITRPALAVICVLILGLVAVTTMVVRSFGSSTAAAQTCSATVTIRVAAAKAMVKPLQAHAERWNKIHFSRGGKCIIASVYEASSPVEAALLANGTSDKPSIWVPDSTDWITEVQSELATSNADHHITTFSPQASLASSPLVLVTTPSRAVTLASSGGATWSSISQLGSQLALENPLVSSDGLVGLTAMTTALSAQPGFNLTNTIGASSPTRYASADEGFAALLADPNTAPMFLATEQEVAAANSAHGSTFASAVYPTDGTLSLDYPAVRLDYPGDDPVLGPGADGFFESFAVGAGPAVNLVGLRDDQGVATPQSGGDVSSFALPFKKLSAPAAGTAAQVLATWPATGREPRVLVAMDVSTLMHGTLDSGESMIGMEADTAISLASGFLPDSAQFGLWGYSTHLTDTLDWLEEVSVGPLGDPYDGGVTRRQAVLAQTSIVKTPANDGSALYDTALAAFYNVTNNYVPGHTNAVVLMTGSGNRDASSVTLDQLLTTLRQRYNPQRPVNIISIAVGNGADNTALNLISAATGGTSYVAESSAQALSILINSLVQK